VRGPLRALAVALTLIDVYLLAILGAAAAGRRPRTPRDEAGERLRFTVLVPAHNEEAMIAATLASLRSIDYPPERWSVVVIADNCSDATAEVAARAGATVLERHDPANRGKGHALNWALDRLDVAADAIAIVDADCDAQPNLLEELDLRLRDGAGAAQADYTVANPAASTSSALRFAAFALTNTVRPLGKDWLGLSSGLLGTGMAFRRSLLARHRFAADSLVEDADLHLRLVAAGERVAFVPETAVRSPMPTSRAVSRAQQTRWEGGRVDLLRTWSASLLGDAARHRDPVRLHAWLELLVPPQSLLALLHVVLGALAVVTRSRAMRWLAVLDGGLQATFVLGGLRLVRAPAPVYRALAAAPVLVVEKLRVVSRLAARGAPRQWERTAR
jgi:1,2-diacylglycerol 3-beta-glucosyltransferase